MSDITIPPAALEAAAMQLPGMAGFPHLVKAALRAGLKAWPGAKREVYANAEEGIFLPLTEKPDAEA